MATGGIGVFVARLFSSEVRSPSRTSRRANRLRRHLVSGAEWLESRQLLTNTVSISASPASIIEGTSDFSVVTFSRTGSAADLATSVYVSVSTSGTATPGTDYRFTNEVLHSNGPYIIPIGQASLTVLLRVDDDAIPESSETAVLTLVPGDYIIGTPGSATVTIVDDDAPQTPPTISSVSASLAEGTYSNQVVATVQLDGKGYNVTSLVLVLTSDDDPPIAPAADKNGFSLSFISTVGNISTYQLRFTGTLDFEGDSDKKRSFDLEVLNGASGPVLVESDATVTITNVANSATASVTKGTSGTLNANWSATKSPTSYSVQLEMANQLSGPWSTVSTSNFGSSTSTSFSGLAYGYYRIVVTATWTGAGSNGDDIATAISSAVRCSAPPVFDSPPTPPAAPAVGNTFSRTACDGEAVKIQILAHDQDSIGSGNISYSVVSENATIVTESGLVYVEIPATAAGGITYTITVRATDDENETADRTFSVVLTRVPPATVSLTGNVAGGRLFDTLTGMKDVTFNWSGTNVSTYQWELYEFQENGDSVVNATDMVLIDSATGVPATTTSKTFTKGVGVYLFRVRALNSCNALTMWQEGAFAIAAMQFVTVNNSEDQCMVCTKLPAESPTSTVSANSGDGGSAVDVTGPETDASLQGFSQVQNLPIPIRIR